VTRTDPLPGTAHLAERAERLRAGAHELTEIRLLTLLRTGQVPAPPEHLATMDRLLGGDGSAPATRLGLPADAGPAAIRDAAAGLHAFWRRAAHSPVTDPVLVRAADVLLRTCEGLLAGVADSPAGVPGG
jgi:hypothetical protein